MANTLITDNIIAKLAIKEFKNNLILARTVDRSYAGLFNNTTGRSIRIREPVRLLATPGRLLKLNAINQRFKTLTIDRRFNVGIELTDEQLKLELNDFQTSIIRPAMQTLANRVDMDLYAKAINFYNYVGSAGTPPSTYAVVSNAAAKMDALGIPREDRYLIASSKDGDALRQGMINYFDPGFVDPILKERSMGRIAGFSAYSAQNVQRPIINTVTGTPLVNGANQIGNSLVVDGLTAGQIIKQGTVFQIANVDFVNALSYTDTQYLANFVVLNDVTADGSGNATLQIAPDILPTGQYQTVTNSPADNATITFQPTHTINLAYHKQAFTLAMINLYEPANGQGVVTKMLVEPNANIAMRMMRGTDIQTSADVCRFDIWYGIQTFEWFGERVMGS